MRICRFDDRGEPRHGLVTADGIVPLRGGLFDTPKPIGDPLCPDDLTWLAPVVPQTFYCVGLNYRGHLLHSHRVGKPMTEPTRPEIGYRANSALTGHRQPIVKPTDVEGRFEAEPELVAVIGRRLKRCSREEARAAVLGWTIGNDVSARQWQHADRTFWRSKNADTFKPMGPWIDTDAQPLESAWTRLSVNGTQVAAFRTGDMIFSPVDFMVEMSRYITLVPGDVLWMGADATAQLESGDVVSISIDGVGTLENPVIAEAT